MNINDYYMQELQALRSDGKKFSERNPGLASFLSEQGQDPDVERLLEGFAFLTGRLRQSIDREFPELTHGLAQLLWPNYLQPIPSYSIVEFKPQENKLESEYIEKGTKLLSYSKAYKTTCPFQTNYAVTVHPIQITKVNYFTNGFGSTIELTFNMTAKINLSHLSLDTLRLYLHGSEHLSQELNLYLNRYVTELEILLGDEEESILKLPPSVIKAVGFEESQNILPRQQNVFYGYILLQEYFCYRDKFNFIDIENLNELFLSSKQELENFSHFRLQIHFDRHLKISDNLNLDSFKLFCSPAVNIFQTETVPIRKGTEEEYELIPAGISLEQSEVLSITKVEGWATEQNLYQEFLPFGSFAHAKKNQEYYYTRVKLSDDQKRLRTFIRFAPNTIEHASFLNEKMTISIDILATNKDIPSTLKLGSINTFDASSPVSDINVQNITIPSKSFLPPLQGDFLWRIISNMSLNYLSLGSIQTFRTLIETYDFPGFNDALHQRKTKSLLTGLTKITYKTGNMIHQGLPIKGIETSLEVDPDHYTSLGEAYVFANVLNEFLALYCNVNTFHHFEVKVDRNDVFQWEPTLGKQTLI